MENMLKQENIILSSYFFHKGNNTFLLKPKENKSTHDLYNETSEKIKIVRILKENEIEFQELETGDIKIV